ncbi:MAG: D-alanine--D-alanine ligase [Eubacterium sp.]|nr:D-alanine--D-alanine ligase [Eubacterium sp.]MBR7072070.1 D-alanine--D-alanine ligase [Eubacterium sp.]
MNIVVLGGGISTERDVSLTSSKNIVKALRSIGENAVLLDAFMGYEGDIDTFFENGADEDAASLIGLTDPSIDEIKKARGVSEDRFFGKNVIKICKKADFVFLGLHGEDGEDGKVQASFDLLGIKYTGTDCLGSALAMNKYYSKQIMVANGIKTADYTVIKKDGNMAKYTRPCVIKPCSGGSSVGVSIVENESEYESAVQKAFKYEDEIIIEEYIKGREFSVGVLGDTVLPPIEIIPKDGFYDYENKYQAGKTIEECPAKLSKEQTKVLQFNTKRVFDALGLKVYGRIDFILNSKDGEFYCLEANSLPGMTQMSLLPQEAAAIGIDYPSLCKEIIRLSDKKYD